MDAQFDGVLARTDSGCLGLAGADGVTPVVWPNGTTLRADGNAIRYRNQELPLGAEVTSTGGEVPDLAEFVDEVPAECGGEGSRGIVLRDVSPAGQE